MQNLQSRLNLILQNHRQVKNEEILKFKVVFLEKS